MWLQVVDFYPKPNSKIITVKEAIGYLEVSEVDNRKNCTPGLITYAKKLKQGEAASKYHPTGSLFGLQRLNQNKPSPTIIKSAGTGILHYSDNLRFLSVNEIKILCSFPIEWKLGNNRSLALDRLGNAVMPKFMQAIAENIKTNILKKEKPTVVSTFCGTGGSSLGYKWAGYKELLAIDFESHAVECFRLNFPEVPCWHKSVLDVGYQEILDFCKIKKGELDVFDGSPPCQGFSTAGKREVNDSRNDLFKRYVYFIENIQPKVFVMENVTGMAKGKMKGKFIEIIKTLKSLNYEVKCKQMNSKYYGVPQSRERLIFIGVRKDIFDTLNQKG